MFFCLQSHSFWTTVLIYSMVKSAGGSSWLQKRGQIMRTYFADSSVLQFGQRGLLLRLYLKRYDAKTTWSLRPWETQKSVQWYGPSLNWAATSLVHSTFDHIYLSLYLISGALLSKTIKSTKLSTIGPYSIIIWPLPSTARFLLTEWSMDLLVISYFRGGHLQITSTGISYIVRYSLP